ncbi:tyrosine-type recombinase/integrase [Streptomyces iconiensis]|uniref:Site-specific integrase n=1 Tax=Streptomyces iconiensis TaxID=1384038 RepID=A0ABT7A671_9ACTN|nr:site-specific integrase [Streptomyces iconiensis]MDJ1136835.1 site-specific integrase [Streptomyces iconiensis]
MIERDGQDRDLRSLVVPRVGALLETRDVWEPYRLLDPAGTIVEPVAMYLKDLQGIGRPATTQRSYGMDLLRWFRFLWAIRTPWDQATRDEARDFSRWIQISDKPRRPGAIAASAIPNPVTGKAGPGRKYAPTTCGHSESVLRGFYDFHRDAGSGPMVNPFPLARRGGRAHAHHNPMDLYRNERSGLYRPRHVQRVPRSIPDEKFNELFAQLGSHRDRALVAFWVSTGARASELLGARYGDADPGQQLITVVRKGTRAIQQLPASPDAFVWLRLYQAQMHGLAPTGIDDPLWWTLRRPFRELGYHAAYRMFSRANAALGANWSLHDLRHTAAYRMARDPDMSLTDVQWVLGHAHLSTTQLYLTPLTEDVIAEVLAHHVRRSAAGSTATTVQNNGPSAPSYRPEALNILFGEGTA